MFKLIDIIKYLTFISYFGFIISAISGFINVSETFDICKLLLSIVVITNTPLIMYVEITKHNADLKVIHYGRAYSQLVTSLMIMGLSNIGLGFSIYGLTIFISNLLLGVFDCDDNRVHPTIDNPNN